MSRNATFNASITEKKKKRKNTDTKKKKKTILNRTKIRSTRQK